MSRSDDDQKEAHGSATGGKDGPGDPPDGPGDADTADDGEGQWRFGLDEVGPDAEPERPPIQPESPRLENVVFVVLGVVGTILLLVAGL